MEYIFCAIFGYLLGCSNMAYYISLFKKVDLRKTGTGNYGTMNAFVEIGKRAGILVFIHDVGKGALAVLLAKWIFPKAALAAYIAGFATVFGHVFPFYMHFKGGKGFAPYGGAVLALNPEYGFLMLAIVIVMILIVNYVVVGNYATIISYPIYLLIRENWQGAIAATVVGTLVGVKHFENIKRIIAGTEKKTRDGLMRKKSVGAVELELAAAENAENPETTE